MPERRGPVIIDLDAEPLPDAPAPAEAPPVPEPDADPHSPAAERALRRAARGRGWGLGRLTLAAALALLALLAGVGVHDTLAGLFARSALLGWPALVLVGLLALAVAVAVAREVAALVRLSRLGRLRRLAEEAADRAERASGSALIDELSRLYGGRPEMAPALEQVREAGADMLDAADLLALAERATMPTLDAGAERAVARAARSVGATTAVLPMPAIDLAVVLVSNIRMIRRIAEIYGGRAGWLGSVRLLRAVAAHLIASGAISAGDDLLGPMIGGGVLGKLSRRFGEAAVNAGLTARVGVAAITVCRPLPFRERPAPRARTLVLAAIGDWSA